MNIEKHQNHQPISKKIIASITLGGALEMYDFTVYSFFSIIIGKHFFPIVQHTHLSWLIALAVFGIGFILKPLGSIIIGHYADQHGRKPALIFTISSMALGTAIIAFTPSYEKIGLFAPALIIIARCIQGFSSGGESGASSSILMESSSKKGFLVSWQMSSIGLASFLGAFISALLSLTLSPQSLENWGWRIAFIFGLLIIPVAFYLRQMLNETLPQAKAQITPKLSFFKQVIKPYRTTFLLGILMTINGSTVTYVTIFYLPIYAIKVLHMPTFGALLTSCITGLIVAIFSPLFGKLSDRLPNRKTLAFIGAITQAITIIPFIWLLNHTANLTVLLIGASLMMFYSALSGTNYFLMIMEAFPIQLRARGMGIIYTIGVAIFGGFAQFNVTWLMNVTHSTMTLAYYTLICCLFAVLAIYYFPSKKCLSK